MIMGDTGAGKSVLQRRILTQVAERGETAIVYDPALEYTRSFSMPTVATSSSIPSMQGVLTGRLRTK